MAYDKIGIRIRWLTGVAQRLGVQAGIPADIAAVTFLQQIQDAIAKNDIVGGKILLSNSEAGGTVSFAMPEGHTPMEIADLCQMAIDSSNGKRRIRQLNVSFAKAIV